MKAVLQRVSQARITVEDTLVSEIGNGLFVLLGAQKGDTDEQAAVLADKCVHLRIFEDEQDKFNLSIKDVGGEMLVASQFTLCADTSRGRRPSFAGAEEPEKARILYERFIQACQERGVSTKGGIFGERMVVCLDNRGPVTIIMEV
ncbi:D-tyrosyl-tRNA(Tyr) deacylase [candidate division WOR-3 bacterium]|nr:D-tyrosyl-tRNA(Tyr) deacylase [candidate division WOR-3 bacterium]